MPNRFEEDEDIEIGEVAGLDIGKIETPVLVFTILGVLGAGCAGLIVLLIQEFLK